MRAVIIDGYVDEPSCLGVPPYIAPYPRYIYGMLRELGIETNYFTIDSFRQQSTEKSFDLAIIIAGIAVPGKYLGGNPLSKKEIFSMGVGKRTILVGPITLELSKKERKMLEDCDIEVVDFPFEERLFHLLGGDNFDLNRFAVRGAEVVTQHPNFPDIICEIETYRGCYWGKCSFCIERIHRFWSRSAKNVVAEIKALYDSGVRHFRLGRQTDFFTYLGDPRYEIPKPNPEALKKFHRAIWDLCPKIKTLHLDNVNPKTVAEYPEECSSIVKTIVLYQTPGNVAAMGLESADENVIRKNSLCASPEDVMDAVALINRYGRFPGYNGLPYFLPGLNFVIGLKGETKATFECNYQFLKDIFEGGLLLRRINIRQVKIFPGTPMEKFGDRNLKKHRSEFLRFKKKVRERIDIPMLRKILPKGRKITDLRVEVSGSLSQARQLATYPLLVNVIGFYRKGTILDARVCDYSYRSVVAIEAGIDVNSATLQQLECALGKMGRKIYVNRPISNNEELKVVGGEMATLYFSVGGCKN